MAIAALARPPRAGQARRRWRDTYDQQGPDR